MSADLFSNDEAPNAAAAEPKLQPKTLQLKERLSPERWERVVERARERVEILETTAKQRQEPGMSWRRALRAVAPEVDWSTYLHWRRRAGRLQGAPWERQLDERVTPEPYRLTPEMRTAASLLRRANPVMASEEAQRHLENQFGAEPGTVSATSLRRIWKAAGLARREGRPAPAAGRDKPARVQARQVEGGGNCRGEVEMFHGGGALALVAAAAAETKVADELTEAVLQRAREVVAAEEAAAEIVTTQSEPTGRDEAGHFTAAYNRAIRGQSDSDPRRRPDAQKRRGRPLSKLALVRSRPDVVAQKLLAMGLTPLLTEKRGFDGLRGPNGDWLGVLRGTAYQPATLDRTLAELAMLDVSEALWTRHAQHWARLTKAWAEAADKPHWLRWALYVDATQDPFWTRSFAKSGKVSRVGRVMPCITRVALMGGAGVPLWVETRAGTVSLKKEFLSTLDRFKKVIGEGELGRLTIIDAEMATASILGALVARPKQWFITVLKGNIEQGAKRFEMGEWQRYREQDLVRESRILLHGEGAPEGGLKLRGVEMQRDESRNPTTTLFATNAPPGELSTADVPTAYLSRWPHQEHRFREGRHGLGMERSFGYAGECVTHVAVETQQEQALKRVERAQADIVAAQVAGQKAQDLLQAVSSKEHQRVAADNLRRLKRELRRAEKRLKEAQEEAQRVATTPREIYARDMTRDGIVTCLKMTILMLIEYVLKEYFGGARMEVRTFIEDYVRLAVTVQTTATSVLFRIAANPRAPEKTRWLEVACAEATRREIRMGERLLSFAVVSPSPGAGAAAPGVGSSPQIS